MQGYFSQIKMRRKITTSNLAGTLFFCEKIEGSGPNFSIDCNHQVCLFIWNDLVIFQNYLLSILIIALRREMVYSVLRVWDRRNYIVLYDNSSVHQCSDFYFFIRLGFCV